MQNILASPTIHASLGCDLDLSGLEVEQECYNNDSDEDNDLILKNMDQGAKNIQKNLYHEPPLTFIESNRTVL